jgi:hypothetical protein
MKIQAGILAVLWAFPTVMVADTPATSAATGGTNATAAATAPAIQLLGGDELKAYLAAAGTAAKVAPEVTMKDAQCRIVFSSSTSRLAAFFRSLENEKVPGIKSFEVRSATPGVDNLNIEIILDAAAPPTTAANSPLKCLAMITAIMLANAQKTFATAFLLQDGVWDLEGEGPASEFVALWSKAESDPRFANLKATSVSIDPAGTDCTFSLQFELKEAGK